MTAASAPSLRLEGVEKRWDSADRRFELMVDAFEMRPGEVVALTGESGSGKSTLLEIAGLASRPDRALRFEIAGRDGLADAAALHARRDAAALAALRSGLGFVLQTGALLPFLTVSENVALSQRLSGREAPGVGGALLDALDLSGVARSYPAALSVGQRQRAAIARAVAHGPIMVLADEPTAALDPTNKGRVVDLLLRLAGETGAAVLVATHERDLYAGRADRHVEIVARRVVGEAAAGADVETVRAELREAA